MKHALRHVDFQETGTLVLDTTVASARIAQTDPNLAVLQIGIEYTWTNIEWSQILKNYHTERNQNETYLVTHSFISKCPLAFNGKGAGGVFDARNLLLQNVYPLQFTTSFPTNSSPYNTFGFANTVNATGIQCIYTTPVSAVLEYTHTSRYAAERQFYTVNPDNSPTVTILEYVPFKQNTLAMRPVFPVPPNDFSTAGVHTFTFQLLR